MPRKRLRRIREGSQRAERAAQKAGRPGREASQISRIIGKTAVKMADDAKALGRGMERVFGEDMTRPGDGVNRFNAGKRAERIVRGSGRKKFAQYDLDRGEEVTETEGRNFFGNDGYKNDTSNDENFWNQRGKSKGDFY